jgi:outer membrane receptor protein involved in Fe transport
MLREPQGLSPIDPIPLGGCVNLDNVTVDDMGRTPYTPGVFTDKLKEDNVSWRVGVDYKLNPDVLLYATIAKGYKAGGHPAATAATNIQFLPVTEESVLDYEAGFKAQLLDNKLSITGAAFFYDYKDKQLRVKLLDPVFGLLDGIRNVPESEVMGAEFTLTATPVEGWTIGMAGTYLDTEITEYSGYNAIAEIVDFAGVAMPFAPETSLSMHTDYSFSLSQNIMGFVGANATHNSHTFSTVGEDEYARIDDYTLVDLRAGIMSPDDRWRVTLWGKNVFDEYYWTNARIVNDVRARYPGRTATYGITFGYRM